MVHFSSCPLKGLVSTFLVFWVNDKMQRDKVGMCSQFCWGKWHPLVRVFVSLLRPGVAQHTAHRVVFSFHSRPTRYLGRHAWLINQNCEALWRKFGSECLLFLCVSKNRLLMVFLPLRKTIMMWKELGYTWPPSYWPCKLEQVIYAPLAFFLICKIRYHRTYSASAELLLEKMRQFMGLTDYKIPWIYKRQ